MSHGEHSLQLHLCLLQLLHNWHNTGKDGHLAVLPEFELESLQVPLLLNLRQLVFDGLLLFCAVGDFLDVVFIVLQIGVQQLRELKVRPGDVEGRASNLHDLLPVPHAYRLLGKLRQQWQHNLEALDGLLQVIIRGPVTQFRRHLATPYRELVHFIRHLVDLLGEVSPTDLAPRPARLNDIHVQIIQLVKQPQLRMSLL